MKRILLLNLGLCVLLTACGKSSGGGSHESAKNGAPIGESNSEQVTKNCPGFLKSDSLQDLMIKASKASVKCGLTEDEVVALLP